ncbi:MAG: hypothetical protein WC728_13545 [Elusimicrobiota bacterium]
MAMEIVRGIVVQHGGSMSAPELEALVHGLVPRALRYGGHDWVIQSLRNTKNEGSQRFVRHALQHEAHAMLRHPKPAVKQAPIPEARESKSDYFRLNLTLPNELDEKLSAIGAHSRATGGAKVRKTEILRALIRWLVEQKVDLSRLRDEEDLLERLKKHTRRL